VLQVLFEIPIFPNSESAAAVSLGRFRSFKSSAVQPPFFPYFVLPLTGVGQNPSPAIMPEFYSNMSYSTSSLLCSLLLEAALLLILLAYAYSYLCLRPVFVIIYKCSLAVNLIACTRNVPFVGIIRS
jgi:hypothetical protein